MEVKEKVVEYANQHGTKPAGRLFNISEGTIRSWRQRGFDKDTPTANRGRKVTYGKELDDELYQGLMAMKSDGNLVTIDQFSYYAKKLIDEKKPELNFKCSRGWVDKFFKRHNLTVTKSEVGKVMNIVECEMKSEDYSNDYANNSNECIIEYSDETEIQNGEISPGEDTDSNYIFNSSHNFTEQITQKRYRTESEDDTSDELTPSKIHKPSTTFHLATDNLPDPKVQEIANLLSTIGKMDASIKPRNKFNRQKKLEVVEHAEIHGSKSAERLFNVPETTVRSWVKKFSITNEQAISLRAEEEKRLLDGGNESSSLQSRVNSGTHSQFNGKRAGTSDGKREIEACVLAWAAEKKRRGECVTFDGLCDQALMFISQENPGSAYSSTRKWVDQFLNLKIRDVLNM